MQIPGLYFMGIRGTVSLQDNILTRLRISSGWSSSSRICDFLSPGDFLAAGSPAWLGLCAVPAGWAASIYQLSYSLRLPWQFLQLWSSSFPIPLPLWVPSGSVFIDLLGRFCLSSSQNRPGIQKPLLISCWKTCAFFQPQFSLIWHFILLLLLLLHFKGSPCSPCFSSQTV